MQVQCPIVHARHPGMLDAAKADYEKLKPPEDRDSLPTSTYVRVQRRLKAIERQKM